MRLLWIGFAEGSAPTQNSPWHINDYATDPEDAELFLRVRRYDAAVVTVGSVGKRPGDAISRFKRHEPEMPVICMELYASAGCEQRLLESGADEFIPYPRSLDGRLVRIRIERLILRYFSDEPVREGALLIDPQRQTVSVDGKAVALRKHPFRLFYCLLLSRRHCVSKEELICKLHAEPEYVRDGSLGQAVTAIRKHLDRKFGIETIRTMRKKGYGFVYNS
jgi:two-component system OmpR family response regulator